MSKEGILLIRTAALGDFILTIPAFKVIRKLFPESEITLLCIDPYRGSRLAEKKYTDKNNNIPWTAMAMPHLFDATITVDSLRRPSDLFALRSSLIKKNITKTFILTESCSPYIGRLKKLLLAKFLTGLLVPVFGWRGIGSLNFNKPEYLHKNNLLKHHVIGLLQFLKELNIHDKVNSHQIEFDLRIHQDAKIWAKNFLNQFPDGSKFIGLIPGSVHSHKAWPLISYKELLELLLFRYHNAIFLIIGSKLDTPIGEKLKICNSSRIFNIAGQTSIQESAAILSECDLVVGNDGGAIHLADAVGASVVSIIPGIEYPNSIEPWNNQENSIRAQNIACAPCYNFTFCKIGTNKCMNEISVELVFDKCKKLLDEITC